MKIDWDDVYALVRQCYPGVDPAKITRHQLNALLKRANPKSEHDHDSIIASLLAK